MYERDRFQKDSAEKSTSKTTGYTLSALGSANNGAMKVLGRYRMNVYVAGRDVKTTVLIVDGLNEEFIIG